MSSWSQRRESILDCLVLWLWKHPCCQSWWHEVMSRQRRGRRMRRPWRHHLIVVVILVLIIIVSTTYARVTCVTAVADVQLVVVTDVVGTIITRIGGRFLWLLLILLSSFLAVVSIVVLLVLLLDVLCVGKLVVLLPLHPSILKPNFDLSLTQAEWVCNFYSSPASQVPVEVKFFLQFEDLVSSICCPLSLGFHARKTSIYIHWQS